jgi:hypothetical protein
MTVKRDRAIARGDSSRSKDKEQKKKDMINRKPAANILVNLLMCIVSQKHVKFHSFLVLVTICVKMVSDHS